MDVDALIDLDDVVRLNLRPDHLRRRREKALVEVVPDVILLKVRVHPWKRRRHGGTLSTPVLSNGIVFHCTTTRRPFCSAPAMESQESYARAREALSFPCSGWECRPGRSASSSVRGNAAADWKRILAVLHAKCAPVPVGGGTTRTVEDGIPTQSVGTRPKQPRLRASRNGEVRSGPFHRHSHLWIFRSDKSLDSLRVSVVEPLPSSTSPLNVPLNHQ